MHQKRGQYVPGMNGVNLMCIGCWSPSRLIVHISLLGPEHFGLVEGGFLHRYQIMLHIVCNVDLGREADCRFVPD